MTRTPLLFPAAVGFLVLVSAAFVAGGGPAAQLHPDTRDWPALFAPDLSDAEFPEGVWTVEDGILTASEDQVLWTKRDYENFILDLEFKTAPGTNSGVIVYCTDVVEWIPNSVEIQIADDTAEEWARPSTWRAAPFGASP
jgi:hypothetical protein